MDGQEKHFERMRESMVQYQLANRDIFDQRVLKAMSIIPRHKFVPEHEQEYAYEDRPLAIGELQTISQPYIVALMTQYLGVEEDSRALEIGTGSGYQMAILAEIGKEVYSVDRIGSLLERAKRLLTSLGYGNIYFKTGDGTLGWQEESPFDRIIVTAAAPKIPEPLFEQLAIGGKMIIPVGSKFVQELTLVVKKKGGNMETIRKGGCIFVPLIGEAGWQNE